MAAIEFQLMVCKSVHNSPPGSIATWALSSPARHVTQDHPVHIRRDLSPGRGWWPSVRFRRGKSRESGLFGSSLFPGSVLGAARRICRTLLLHKVKCSNSRLGAYAESTSGRRSSWPCYWFSRPARRSGYLCSRVRPKAAPAPRRPQESRHQHGGAPGPYEHGRPWRQRPRPGHQRWR